MIPQQTPRNNMNQSGRSSNVSVNSNVAIAITKSNIPCAQKNRNTSSAQIKFDSLCTTSAQEKSGRSVAGSLVKRKFLTARIMKELLEHISNGGMLIVKEQPIKAASQFLSILLDLPLLRSIMPQSGGIGRKIPKMVSTN